MQTISAVRLPDPLGGEIAPSLLRLLLPIPNFEASFLANLGVSCPPEEDCLPEELHSKHAAVFTILPDHIVATACKAVKTRRNKPKKQLDKVSQTVSAPAFQNILQKEFFLSALLDQHCSPGRA